MRIQIRAKDGPKHLTLFLPLSFVKSKFMAKAIAKDDNVQCDPEVLHKMFKEAYSIIKAYIKENGHFYLVDIQSGDGDIVRIRL